MLTSNLSEKQIEAVNAIDDDIEIIACAGAGKTGVVTRRIINILKSKPDVSTSNIVAFTFTKKAAEELAVFPTSHQLTGFRYRGYDIYMKPQSNHLLFYTIDNDKGIVTVLRILQDGMDWEYIIQRWIQINS